MAADEEKSGLESLQSDLMKSLRTQPWAEATREPEGMSAEQKEQHYHECQRIAAVFMSDHGKAALDELRRKTVDQPTFPYRSVDANLLFAYGCAREGQNQIVRYIEYCIRRVEQGPPVARESDDNGE